LALVLGVTTLQVVNYVHHLDDHALHVSDDGAFCVACSSIAASELPSAPQVARPAALESILDPPSNAAAFVLDRPDDAPNQARAPPYLLS
jgi:hypothetical protein